MSNYQIIKEAIINKQPISAVYNGKYREMCPHVIGKKNGRNQALFYQFGGESNSSNIIAGSASNWRCIQIDGLSNIKVISGGWHTASNHSIPSTCVDEIDVEVSF